VGPDFIFRKSGELRLKPRNSEYVVSEMAKALERLYLDKELRLRLGAAARKRAKNFMYGISLETS